MLTELFCRGADDEQSTFYLELPEKFDSWPLRVRVHRRNPPNPAEDDWFSLTLDRFRDGLIVAEIDHHSREWYSRKGIGDALLPEMAALTGMRIYSSSNVKEEYPEEFRSLGAGKLWLRLLQERIASYLPEDDRFTLPRAEENARETELSSNSLLRPATAAARPATPLATFPDILPTSQTVTRFRPIQDLDIKTKSDLEQLMWLLYDDPDCVTYLYFDHGKPLNDLVRHEEAAGKLDLAHTEYYYYKHPAAKSRRDFLQIAPASLEEQPEEEWEREYLTWQKALVAVGPMYAQITLRLTPRMQRHFEMLQAARIQRETDTNPVELKPNIYGFGIDLPKLWRLIKRKFSRRKP